MRYALWYHSLSGAVPSQTAWRVSSSNVMHDPASLSRDAIFRYVLTKDCSTDILLAIRS